MTSLSLFAGKTVGTIVALFLIGHYEIMEILCDNNQADFIEAFNSTSRYLDDLLNIDNPHFEQMV